LRDHRADPRRIVARHDDRGIEAVFGDVQREERRGAPLRRWPGLLHARGTAATLDQAGQELARMSHQASR